MTIPPHYLDKLHPFDRELRERIEAERGNGLTEAELARILLSASLETAMMGDTQEFFDHILWVQSEGDRYLRDFEKHFGDMIDIEALCRGELKAKA